MLEQLSAAAASSFVIDPFVVFTLGDWDQDADRVMLRVKQAQVGPTVVVRSSARSEDVDVTIAPGLFRSVLNVSALDKDAVARAVDKVRASYAKHALTAADVAANEIIIQSQLLMPRFCGIAHLSDGLPYIHIDYDESVETNRITSGLGCKTVDVLNLSSIPLPSPWSEIRQAVVDVRAISAIVDVIIEFAFADGHVHVFQARPHAAPCESTERLSSSVVSELRDFASSIDSDRTIWSNMTDWNPAELVGVHPRPLAESLYQYLISDFAWLSARQSLGYRAVRQPQLVETIAGRPYVNVRTSFLSLTPAGLDETLANRLVEDRLIMLRSEPWLHDKVETALLFTAADVGSPSRTKALTTRGFSSNEVSEIDRHLQVLTNELFASQPQWAASDAQLAATLKTDTDPERDKLMDPTSLARRVTEQLELCRGRGVIPFARQARLAFVARDLLGRLRDAAVISAEWEATWWASVRTVVHDVIEAFQSLANGYRGRFDELVGHLREHTFDICSPRYDAIATFPLSADIAHVEPQPVVIDHDVAGATESALRATGLQITAKQFFEFAAISTQLRERLKFTYSRVLSSAIETTAALGAAVGLSREEMAFATVADLRKLSLASFGVADARAYLTERIAERKDRWERERVVVLPTIAFASADLFVVQKLPGSPNFVTELTVEGDLVVLDGASVASGLSLAGKIVAIEAADPGFDWIFASRLAGLVTKFGGATSHMAVRCAQLRLPAAIGCGEELFKELTTGRRIRLDCSARAIDVVRNVSLAASETNSLN